MAIKVKLRDSSSIFRDASQGITIVGKEPVEVKRTPTIVESINGGALILVESEKVEQKPDTSSIGDVDPPNVDTDDDQDDLTDVDDDQDSEDGDIISKEDIELSLTDLKEKYPEVKGRSKDSFLENLKVFLSKA